MRKRNKRSSIFYYHLYLCRWKWHPTHHQHILPSNWILDFTRQQRSSHFYWESVRMSSFDFPLSFAGKKWDISFSHLTSLQWTKGLCRDQSITDRCHHLLLNFLLVFWQFVFEDQFNHFSVSKFTFKTRPFFPDNAIRVGGGGTNFPAVNWESSKELILHPQSFFR